VKIEDINLEDYNYDLPEERIAQYPVSERDLSQILIYRKDKISKDIFRNISKYIQSDSLLVFNNTRVIKARILFPKESGAVIEILCLEPLNPAEYELSLGSEGPVEWKCLVGNIKKWKNNSILYQFTRKGKEYALTAEKIRPEGEAWRILFSWNCPHLSFGQVIEIAGHIPLPPYINREDEPEDNNRYQTVYSVVKGSVAAPTAGLHFTANVFESLHEKQINSAQITLHVGAGTFKPVKTNKILDHEMHCEHFTVKKEIVRLFLLYPENIIAVGTTSVRTLESLYWLGARLLNNKSDENADFSLSQWEVYKQKTDISVKESMEALLFHMDKHKLESINASTSILIVPGYKFRMINGIMTNFHQPRSTLLLLISAWTGKNWKKIYKFAYDNNFRYLSYGDSSLLMR
jgi:S-adenosylmethionine:tRNA ribosyltransferase-isomerase